GDFERRKMLGVAQHDGGDANQAGLPERFAQQRIGALAALGRYQVVGAFEKPIVDLFGLDETTDVYRPALFERRRLEIFLRQDNEAAFLVLEAFDELLPRHGLPFTLTDALEAHRRF